MANDKGNPQVGDYVRWRSGRYSDHINYGTLVADLGEYGVLISVCDVDRVDGGKQVLHLEYVTLERA